MRLVTTELDPTSAISSVPNPDARASTRTVACANGRLDKTEQSVRLFMAPGMGHCSGGDGPNTFDMVTALAGWVEQGKAPERVIAAHNRIRIKQFGAPVPQFLAATITGSHFDLTSVLEDPEGPAAIVPAQDRLRSLSCFVAALTFHISDAKR